VSAVDGTLVILVLTVMLALGFDFINGFHDTANAIATAVSTRALRLRTAITLAAVMNFLGAITFTGVAKTIARDIVDPYQIANGSIVIMAALISAIMWNLLTWYYGIPSSSSHTLIGSIAGAAIAANGFSILNYHGFLRIIQALIASPLIAFVLGYLMLQLLKNLFKKARLYETNRNLRKFQIITVALQAFTHGTNDAQKSMGIITMALMTAGYHTGHAIPLWVQVSCALAMALGTSAGGWRIIKTVGTQIVKIRPISGVAADLTSAFIIFSATHFGLPVSTTHVIASGIMGVGTAYRPRAVKWNTGRKMLVAWLITLPISTGIGAVIYYLLTIVRHFVS
jgi:PiT family inorganic phosphate transporter